MDNDGMNLLHEEFDYMIDELVNNGVIKENDKEVELSEYVGNVLSDVKVEDMKKEDFVKISGEERYSTDEKGNEYLNVKAVYSKILKTRLVMNIKLKIKKTKEVSYRDSPQGLSFFVR